MDIGDLWDDSLPQRGSEAWNSASLKEKEDAIIRATSFLDLLPYKGLRQDPLQGCSWPRTDVFRDDGSPVTGVPEEFKQATAMVAGFILAEIPYDVPALAWVYARVGHLLEEGTDLRDSDITWH